MNIYAIRLFHGRVGLIAAESQAKAEDIAYREQGTDNVLSVRLATNDQIEWVRAMGGSAPEIGALQVKK